MSVELKIKSKHLSEEARIIRFEENKIKARARKMRAHQFSVEADAEMQTYHSLHEHRKKDVGRENRATYLARAYIAGVPYRTVEQKRKDESEFVCYIRPRIYQMVAKYGAKLPKKWDRTEQKYMYPAEEFADLQKKINDWSA